VLVPPSSFTQKTFVSFPTSKSRGAPVPLSGPFMKSGKAHNPNPMSCVFPLPLVLSALANHGKAEMRRSSVVFCYALSTTSFQIRIPTCILSSASQLRLRSLPQLDSEFVVAPYDLTPDMNGLAVSPFPLVVLDKKTWGILGPNFLFVLSV